MLSIHVLDKLRIDDPIGAISVHGSAGIFGLLVVPLASPEASYATQLLGIAVLISWGVLASYLVWKVLDLTLGIRVSEQQEYDGLDAVECGVEAYPEFVRMPHYHQPESAKYKRPTSVWEEAPSSVIFKRN